VSEEQKKSQFFALPNVSNLGEAKVTTLTANSTKRKIINSQILDKNHDNRELRE